MDRETKTITTPLDKHVVVIKSWITGREKRALVKPFTEAVEVSVGAGGKSEFKSKEAGSVIEKAANLVIETIVVSVNGKTEGILNLILDMKSQDTDFVVKELDKVSAEKDFTKPEPKQ